MHQAFFLSIFTRIAETPKGTLLTSTQEAIILTEAGKGGGEGEGGGGTKKNTKKSAIK